MFTIGFCFESHLPSNPLTELYINDEMVSFTACETTKMPTTARKENESH